MTQNRYYSNDGYAVNLTAQISSTSPSIQVSSMTNWPTTGPFVLSIEPGTLQEELVLVAPPVGSGTSISPLTVTRGFDNTTAQSHPLGATVVPKICQLDLAEPQQHLNLTGSASSAHGLPASAWLGGQYQLVSKQVLSTSQSSVTFNSAVFSSIPPGYNNVVIFANAKTSNASVEVEQLLLQINGWTGPNYGSSYIQQINTAPSTIGAPSGQPTGGGFSLTSAACGLCWASGAGAGPSGVGRNVITFPFYSDTVWAKGYTFQATASDGASTSYTSTGGGTCASVTLAISSLTLFPQSGTSNFLASSLFALYAY